MTEYFRPDYTPEWFHLENYEPLKDMSREEIHAIICTLVSCYMDLPNGTEITIPAEGDEPDEIFIAYPSGFLEELEKGLPIKSPDNTSIVPVSSVRPYTISDYFITREHIKENRNEYYASRGFESFSEPVPESKYLLPAITVQLRHDDAKILNDFAIWLKYQRENSHLKQNDGKWLSDTNFQKLIRDRLIPCMHLLIWGMSKEIHYPDSQLRLMIFPDGACSGDRQMTRYRKMALEYLESPTRTINIL